MNLNLKHIKSNVLGLLLSAICLFISISAYAQSPVISDENAQLAINFSEIIKDKKLLTESLLTISDLNLEALSPEEKLRHLRQHALGVIALSNKLDPKSIFEEYQTAIEEIGNERDKSVYELQFSFFNTVDVRQPNNITDTIINELELAANNEDWFISNNAWLLLSVINSFKNNTNLALQQAQEAYRKIPNDISPYVTDARISTLARTTYLNNLLLNPELAIENTSNLIQQKQAAGYPIDGSSLLNNLLYSLSMWREYEVSTHIAEVLLDIERETVSNTPGLTELRVAQLLSLIHI